MPWTPQDATSHTKMATTETIKRLWCEIANQILAKSGDEDRAIREANAIIARTAPKMVELLRGKPPWHLSRRPRR
jgi:hypothetical protein